MHRFAMHSSNLVDDYLIRHYAPKTVVAMVTRWVEEQEEKEQKEKDSGAKPPLCKYRPKAGGVPKIVVAQ